MRRSLPSKRWLALLGGGVALAAVGIAAAGGAAGSAPAAEISGAADRAEETAAFANAAGDPAPAPMPAVVAAPAAATAPAAQLDLDHIERVGDHFEAPYGAHRAILTLDPQLQAAAEDILARAQAPRGAVVAMAPDGRILALAGRRTDDHKGRGDGASDWHLATDVWAPAASVFKLVTASALVGAGVDPDDKVCFHGGIRSVLESNLRDDKHDNQCQSLTFGVAHSNNAILGKLAYQHLDPSALAHAAHDLLAIDRPLAGPLAALGVRAGSLSLPTEHDLSFAQASAGFAGSQLSVVGGAMLAATFADGGDQPEPQLIASVIGGDASVRAPAMRHAIDAQVARAVGKMMAATCEFGSASKSFRSHRKLSVAGKTGTLTQEQPFYMQYSWFVGFAPIESPDIVVSVVLGNPEDWKAKGHEVAEKLIEAWQDEKSGVNAGGRARDREQRHGKRRSHSAMVD